MLLWAITDSPCCLYKRALHHRYEGRLERFLYFLVDRTENVFKTDTTIFTTVAGLFIPLRDRVEGSWNNKSYLSEECIILMLSKASIPRAFLYKAEGCFRIYLLIKV